MMKSLRCEVGSGIAAAAQTIASPPIKFFASPSSEVIKFTKHDFYVFEFQIAIAH